MNGGMLCVGECTMHSKMLISYVCASKTPMKLNVSIYHIPVLVYKKTGKLTQVQKTREAAMHGYKTS